MRILVCGSRTWNEQNIIVHSLLSGIKATLDPKTIMHIIEGGAKGADACAANWCQGQKNVIHHQFKAEWDKYGKAAGYRRNVRMLEEGEPALVLAFVDKPLDESRGTAMMVSLAKEANVKVYVTERH